MKKFNFLFLILVLFVFTASSYAQEKAKFKEGSEPNGFRGIDWGTKIDKIQDTKGLEFLGAQKNIDMYSRKGDNLKIGNANLTAIAYCFWNGKFVKVDIIVNDPVNYQNLKKEIFSTFGEAPKTNWDGMDCYAWEGDKSDMVLSEFNQMGVFMIMSKEMQKTNQAQDKGF